MRSLSCGQSCCEKPCSTSVTTTEEVSYFCPDEMCQQVSLFMITGAIHSIALQEDYSFAFSLSAVDPLLHWAKDSKFQTKIRSQGMVWRTSVQFCCCGVQLIVTGFFICSMHVCPLCITQTFSLQEHFAELMQYKVELPVLPAFLRPMFMWS